MDRPYSILSDAGPIGWLAVIAAFASLALGVAILRLRLDRGPSRKTALLAHGLTVAAPFVLGMLGWLASRRALGQTLARLEAPSAEQYELAQQKALAPLLLGVIAGLPGLLLLLVALTKRK